MVPELPTAVKVLFAKMTPRRVVEEPLLLSSQVVPSDDVRTYVDSITMTKVLFP